MKKVSTMYLVRHGESQSNQEGVVGGQTDYPLTDEGRAQAQSTKQALQHIHFDTAYSSDLQRAADTAEIIFGEPVETRHRLRDLRERNFGSLEGQPHAEYARLRVTHRETAQSMQPEERWRYTYGIDMESNEALSNRIMKSLRMIGDQYMGKTILVAMHGGPIRTTLMRLGFATEDDLPPGSFGNGGFVELKYDGHDFEIINVVGINKHKVITE